MKIALYFAILPLHVLIWLLKWPLGIVAVLFFSSEDKLTITALKWLMTDDNDMRGDSGWREEHLIGSNPLSVLNRIRWLWRNGGNHANYFWFGIPEITGWASSLPHTYGTYRYPTGHFLYYKKIRFIGPLFFQLTVGWALFGPQNGRVKYVFTPRLKTKD
jgi:hypothetical protein